MPPLVFFSLFLCTFLREANFTSPDRLYPVYLCVILYTPLNINSLLLKVIIHEMYVLLKYSLLQNTVNCVDPFQRKIDICVTILDKKSN